MGRAAQALLGKGGINQMEIPWTDAPARPPTANSCASTVPGPTAGTLATKGEVWMAAKQLAYSDEARQKLLAGVSKLARAVRSTLGPRGRNAVLDKGWGSPNVTKDGVTVAEEIELQDPYENMGAQLVKEAA